MTASVGEFTRFISKTNAVELAVAFVLAMAFVRVVSSLVSDLIVPIVGSIFGGFDVASLSVSVGQARITYGKFIESVLSFLVVALSVFGFLRLLKSAGIKL